MGMIDWLLSEGRWWALLRARTGIPDIPNPSEPPPPPRNPPVGGDAVVSALPETSLTLPMPSVKPPRQPPEAPAPPLTIASLERYRDYGVPVGDFLQAVLRNDLLDALCRADSDNLAALRAIALWVHWELPSRAHGSAGAVEGWIAQHREAKGG